MPHGDDPHTTHPQERIARLRHDLKTPLAVILGRAQLLRRAVQRSPSLSAEEREKMLAGLAVIEESVHTAVALSDRVADGWPSRREDEPT